MTAKQRAARAKFKAVVAEAKKLRKKNPKLTQAQAVKQAWAISYSKQRAGVGNMPISKYNVGDKVYSYQNKNKAAKIVYKKFVPWESLSKPNSKDKYVYKLKLDDGFSNYINEESLSKKKLEKVGAVKKKTATKVKAKKRASTEMHTDTKSHNVNIRVISGIAKAEKAINAKLLDELNDILNKIRNDEEVRDSYKIALKYGKIQKEDRPKARGIVKFYNQNIKEYKEHFRQLKKQLK